MPIVFEQPPEIEGRGSRFTRERSPERKEMDELLTELTQYPDQWARLYDFVDKEDAEKHAGKLRSAAGYLGTGKSWSITIRNTEHGSSIFAKMSSEPARKRNKKAKDAETQEPADAYTQPDSRPVEAEHREPTFQ